LFFKTPNTMPAIFESINSKVVCQTSVKKKLLHTSARNANEKAKKAVAYQRSA